METIDEEAGSTFQSNDRAQSINAIAVSCYSLFRAVLNRDFGLKETAIQNRISLLFWRRAKQQPILTLEDLRDDFESFRVWTKNLGVFATDNSSLDFRLREASEVRDDLVSLIRSIATDLHESQFLLEKNRSFESNDDYTASSSDSGDDRDSELQLPALTRMAAFELQARFRNISEIVDKLMSLGELIRASGVRSRTMRAAKYEHVEDGVNHTTLFENEYLPIVLRHRFKVEEPLLTRLSNAIALRRRQFLYQAKHQKRLAYGGGAPEEPPKAPVHAEHKLTAKSTSCPIPISVQTFTAGNRSGGVTQTPTNATTFKIENRPIAPSRIVSASNKSMTRGVDFPPPPQPSSHRSSHFECPYCRLLVPVKKLEPKFWHQHVIADLQPFVCVEPDCPNPDVLLESKTDWIEHQKWTHAMEWWCEGEDNEHAALRFSSEDDFIEHQRRSHGPEMSKEALQRRLLTAGHPSLTPFNCCPFCDFLPERLVDLHLAQTEDAVFQTVTTQKSLQEHLHHEVIVMFLLALPERDDLVDTGSVTGTERPLESRSTIDDVLDDSLSITSSDSILEEQYLLEENEDWHYVWTSSNTKHSIRANSYAGHESDEVIQTFLAALLLKNGPGGSSAPPSSRDSVNCDPERPVIPDGFYNRFHGRITFSHLDLDQIKLMQQISSTHGIQDASSMIRYIEGLMQDYHRKNPELLKSGDPERVTNIVHALDNYRKGFLLHEQKQMPEREIQVKSSRYENQTATSKTMMAEEEQHSFAPPTAPSGQSSSATPSQHQIEHLLFKD
ncbi:hypothetical protein H2200_008771 [Cladophialophora chaetospira]|uniref:Oxidoreductase acuF-like C2H2 type zinc-finger domain-containing protein n=1 Tax=Cladophialophora chaetospira TaxID=386627 RepID=A0AA38X4N1_9EURO|nr:hypothetical protein H2200_008771 [Cladophialophora chaetospira]